MSQAPADKAKQNVPGSGMNVNLTAEQKAASNAARKALENNVPVAAATPTVTTGAANNTQIKAVGTTGAANSTQITAAAGRGGGRSKKSKRKRRKSKKSIRR